MTTFRGIIPSNHSTATFSQDRRYRYELWRRWSEGSFCLFICLNPSTADEFHDDPTLRRCKNFAKSWGYAAVCMTNLFAYRATKPQDMKAQNDPIGELNDNTLIGLATNAQIVIAAWGVHGCHNSRDKQVMKVIPDLYCLGTTKGGFPRHPLYLPQTTKPGLLNPAV